MTSTMGKLEVLQRRYQSLGSCSIDAAFDDNWKQEVDEKVSDSSKMSEAYEDGVIDKEIESSEIALCIRDCWEWCVGVGASQGSYGGSGMIDLLQQLFLVIWLEEFVGERASLFNLLKKGDNEDPDNYRGIIWYPNATID